MDKKKAIDLLNKIERSRGISLRSYTRYMWRPGTATGNKDHERHQEHEEKLDNALKELRAMIEKEPG